MLPKDKSEEQVMLVAPKYITHPTMVRWFGPRVTRSRAVLCLAFSLINAHVPLYQDFPTFVIRDATDFLQHIAGYIFEYLLLLGALSVTVAYLFGFFVVIITKIVLLKRDPLLTGEQSQIREELFEERAMNLFLITFELLLLYGHSKGIVWPRPKPMF